MRDVPLAVQQLDFSSSNGEPKSLAQISKSLQMSVFNLLPPQLLCEASVRTN